MENLETKGEDVMDDFDVFVCHVRALKDLGYCSTTIDQMSNSELELKITVDIGGFPHGVTVESVRKAIESL